MEELRSAIFSTACPGNGFDGAVSEFDGK